MLLLRRSWVRASCLAFVMGLGLSWPALVHHTLHEQSEHGHDHRAAETHSSNAPLQLYAGNGDYEHPHLELTTTRPSQSALHLVFLVTEVASLELPALAPLRRGITARGATGPRSPPGTPPPSIRAPPAA
jgi:hypothetical protein